MIDDDYSDDYYEEYYSDLMSRILCNDRFSYSKVLKEDDKKLLEDFSPQLFAGINSERKAIRAMFRLVKTLYAYRYENSIYSIPHDAHNRTPTYKHQSLKTKADKLQEKIIKAVREIDRIMKPILDLMGGETLHTHKSAYFKQHYKDMLEDVLREPMEYIPSISKKGKNDKKAIESYLYSLKLQGKSNVIESFITAIK